MADILRVEVPVEMTITRETAERCCKILSMYLTDNPQTHIQEHFKLLEDGAEVEVEPYERSENGKDT